jgi:hypothetical protein
VSTTDLALIRAVVRSRPETNTYAYSHETVCTLLEALDRAERKYQACLVDACAKDCEGYWLQHKRANAAEARVRELEKQLEAMRHA